MFMVKFVVKFAGFINCILELYILMHTGYCNNGIRVEYKLKNNINDWRYIHACIEKMN